MMVALGEGQGNLQLRGSWVAREMGKVHLSPESASGLTLTLTPTLTLTLTLTNPNQP